MTALLWSLYMLVLMVLLLVLLLLLVYSGLKSAFMVRFPGWVDIAKKEGTKRKKAQKQRSIKVCNLELRRKDGWGMRRGGGATGMAIHYT